MVTRVLLIAAVVLLSGCRVLRRQQASEEGIAAARQLSLQAIDAQQRGQWDRAEMLFASAILKCPTDERARFGYAESLWQRGAREQAIAHMEEAIRLSGDDPERLVRLGQMHLALGDLASAARQADLAIAANPQFASAWALRGHVLHAQANRSEALASFHRALSYQQHLPDVQLAVSEIYAHDNRPQRALATLQALAVSYPLGRVPAEVLYREGLALQALGRHQDAANMLTRAREDNSPSTVITASAIETRAPATSGSPRLAQ